MDSERNPKVPEEQESVKTRATDDEGDGADKPEKVQSSEEAEQAAEAPSKKKVDLLKVEVNSESAALNVLIGFIGIAQRRGAYAVNESAKVYEAIKFFMET